MTWGFIYLSIFGTYLYVCIVFLFIVFFQKDESSSLRTFTSFLATLRHIWLFSSHRLLFLIPPKVFFLSARFLHTDLLLLAVGVGCAHYFWLVLFEYIWQWQCERFQIPYFKSCLQVEHSCCPHEFISRTRSLSLSLSYCLSRCLLDESAGHTDTKKERELRSYC